MSTSDTKFWNNSDIVTYFAQKDCDPRILKRLSTISNPQSMKALDLGCGGGRHTEMLITLGFETYSCDINPAMVEQTKKRAAAVDPEYPIDKRILHGEILAIPFEDKQFDVVVTTGVLHQAMSVEQYDNAIEELARVCKIGTVVCLNIFTSKIMDPTYTILDPNGQVVETKEGLGMTLLSKEVFYDLMKKHGFELEEELAEDIKEENTGPRAVLRSHFIKKS